MEIGANRQSCDPSTTLLFKLVLEVVVGAPAGCVGRMTRQARTWILPGEPTG
jgi:hypothetical protein